MFLKCADLSWSIGIDLFVASGEMDYIGRDSLLFGCFVHVLINSMPGRWLSLKNQPKQRELFVGSVALKCGMNYEFVGRES